MSIARLSAASSGGDTLAVMMSGPLAGSLPVIPVFHVAAVSWAGPS